LNLSGLPTTADATSWIKVRQASVNGFGQSTIYPQCRLMIAGKLTPERDFDSVIGMTDY
jgi:hypothetical protein